MNGGGNHVFPPLASVSPRLPIWADSSPHREAVAGMSSGRRAGGGGESGPQPALRTEKWP